MQSPPPPKTPQVTWPVAFVIVSVALFLLTSVSILALRGLNVGEILGALSTFVVAMMAALGFSLHNKMDRVEHQVNGRLTEQIEINQQLREENRKLALAVPSSTPDPVTNNNGSQDSSAK